MDHLKLSTRVAKQAGKLLLQEFKRGKIAWHLKSTHEIITRADTTAEQIILSALKKATPIYQILSEESGLTQQKSDYLWVVDPLDGTTNFKLGNPLFSVSIALYYRGDPQVGVVYAPFLNELYTAEVGKGAYLNGKRLHVSKMNSLAKSFLTFCYGQTDAHMRRAVELYRYFKLRSVDMRQLGSAAIELAWVAAGRTESIVIPGVRPWDAAAGALLVTEAGGTVTNFANKPWRFVAASGKVEPNVDLLATNKKLHKVILDKIE